MMDSNGRWGVLGGGGWVSEQYWFIEKLGSETTSSQLNAFLCHTGMFYIIIGMVV